MINKQKARNSKALKNRLLINKKYSKNDLNDWIFSLFSIKEQDKILDICCGQGKQTFLFSKKAKKGLTYALDISAESLNEIEEKKKKNIKTILMDIDSIPNTPFKENYFNCIHCSYGLYYAKKPKKIIRQSYSLLQKQGLLIIIGPTDDNNKELFNFIEKLYPIDKKIIFTSRDFMNKVVLPEVQRLFSKIKKAYFTNEISYPNFESLYTYIKSSTMHRSKFDKQLQSMIVQHFKDKKKFKIAKKAMAIIAIK